jgi:hypothetical protein
MRRLPSARDVIAREPIPRQIRKRDRRRRRAARNEKRCGRFGRLDRRVDVAARKFGFGDIAERRELPLHLTARPADLRDIPKNPRRLRAIVDVRCEQPARAHEQQYRKAADLTGFGFVEQRPRLVEAAQP